MTNRIIYYYQTFTTLQPVLNDPKNVTHIHLSSIHFGVNPDNSPYIHLNDHSPSDPKFNNVWKELNDARDSGIKIVLMVGGAGGAFSNLFSNFDVYYSMLYDLIEKYPVIEGIDLDVEEEVDINNIKKLINCLDKDFGSDFIISMAPVAPALEGDQPGFGGFVYKDFFKEPEGQRIDYFNGQFYGCFDFETYDAVIKNGFPEEKINFGMVSGNYTPSTFPKALAEVAHIKAVYPNFGGVFIWEYFDAPPGDDHHQNLWAEEMYEILNSESSYAKDIRTQMRNRRTQVVMNSYPAYLIQYYRDAKSRFKRWVKSFVVSE
jgi:hypothetical protein